jgi:hypothetical protein
METTSADSCEHARAVRISVERSLAAQHRTSHLAELAATMNRDEIQARCQAECGDASPWHGVELRPVDGKVAAESLRPPGLIDELVDAVARFGRRLRGRGAA